MGFRWTEDVLKTARWLYLEQGLSASESARRLGVTRSALIGKSHRMGWAAERDPQLAIANQVRGGRAVARALRPSRPDVPLPPAHLVPASSPRPWMQRAPGQCAFPVSGERETLMSCCAPSGLQSYCPAHTAAMYVRRSADQMRALDRIAEWVDRIEQPAPMERDAARERARAPNAR